MKIQIRGKDRKEALLALSRVQYTKNKQKEKQQHPDEVPEQRKHT